MAKRLVKVSFVAFDKTAQHVGDTIEITKTVSLNSRFKSWSYRERIEKVVNFTGNAPRKITVTRVYSTKVSKWHPYNTQKHKVLKEVVELSFKEQLDIDNFMMWFE